MNRFLMLAVSVSLTALAMSGARAYPRPRTVTQPDGTRLTLVGHGDEFRHYVTTSDGYTVVKDEEGVYRYALLVDGKLRPSRVKASEEESRSSSENAFVKSLKKGIMPEMTVTGEKLGGLHLSARPAIPEMSPEAGARRMKGTLDEYRGLVILVNFTDRKFSRGEAARGMVDDMMNEEGRTGYMDPLFKGSISCTGSVRDYFSDNSSGLFKPSFDVVGPIEVDVDQYYIDGVENTYDLCARVLKAADQSVDYTRYDYDGDGKVDMFYIIYAGYASVYQDNDTRLVWPHAGDFADSDEKVTLDGMDFGRFACSSELYGWHDDGDLYLDGIGVIVHEFSHILGFKDHYDVSGFLNEDPGEWDVMASGNYGGILNDTPCGYNSYEKYSAGFISPRTVTSEDAGERILLRPLSESNDAVRFASCQDSTLFLLENRQPLKWDRYLPGHGMLVWRVDSCQREYWDHNALNVSARSHFKLVRAMGATRSLFREIEDTDYDSFPGTKGVTEITNFTKESNLLTDLNYPSSVTVSDITETDGDIALTLGEDVFAEAEPYVFGLREAYSAKGVLDAENMETGWKVSTGIVQTGGAEKRVIYNLVPDTDGRLASFGGIAGIPYYIGSDRLSVTVEPFRVAVDGEYGIWLVDFTDLDNGGSGAVQMTMDPYGRIALANSGSVLGYCLLPRTSVVVSADKIAERFSTVKDVEFDVEVSGLPELTRPTPASGSNDLFDLQGRKVSKGSKNEIVVRGSRKMIVK